MRKGFTFIELLVSITIILVISTFAVVTYQSANKKARDNRRLADLEQIRAALEMYRSDEDKYPGDVGVLDDDPSPYLNQIPDDPKDGLGYAYKRVTLYTYTLDCYMEVEGDGSTYGSCGDETCNYRLENP